VPRITRVTVARSAAILADGNVLGMRMRHLVTVLIATIALLASATSEGPAEAQRASSLGGDLLVASPEMRDPRFARTVVYLIRHDASGAQGFVVNRPLGDIALGKLLEQMRRDGSTVSGHVRLHGGGPMEGRRMFVLHTGDYTSPGTTAIKNGVSVTSDPEILQSMAQGQGPRRVRIVVGYAGWGPGQLEAELEAGAWIRAAADESLLFDDDYDKKWERAQTRRKLDL
jgi:putative transcriptional regulator